MELPYVLERTVAPTLEPIDLAAAKHQCNLDINDTSFDHWFSGGDGEVGAIAAARELVESDTNLALMNQTYQLKLQCFPCESFFDLLIHPVRSISSVVTIDTAGDSQAWSASNYEVLRSRFFSHLLKPESSTNWPTVSATRQFPITITCVAGYPDPATDLTDPQKRAKVPAAAKKAMLLLIAHWFKNREAVLTGTISKDIELSYESLLQTIRPKHYA